MDKTMIGFLTGASALVLVGGVESSAAASFDHANALEPARSFAELLEPIPHATDILRAEHERDAARAVDAADQKPFEVAQYQQHHYYHHHHHNVWPWRRNYHHHHHHHYRYNYHHHHHHHHYQHHYY